MSCNAEDLEPAKVHGGSTVTEDLEERVEVMHRMKSRRMIVQ